VTRPAFSPDDATVPGGVCAACAMLCDDIAVVAGRTEHACASGAEALRAALVPRQPSAAAWQAGGPISEEHALGRAAEMLATARRPLVTGLAGCTVEAVVAACDLADAIHAAIDPGAIEAARAAGPTIARAGEVTAAWEELRDRADLVLLWHCDPCATHPRFRERLLDPPLVGGGRRETIAVAAAPPEGTGAPVRHLPALREAAVEMARAIHLLVTGRSAADCLFLPPPLAAQCVALHEAIRRAACVAIVTADTSDRVGLEPWSVVHLVRAIAHEKPAFQIPLGPGIAGGPGSAAGAAAVLAWRYGGAGAVARADRVAPRLLPGEGDAERLIARGEVDVVLAVGQPTPAVAAAIAARGDDLGIVALSDAPAPLSWTGAQGIRSIKSIQLRCPSLLTETSGTLLRGDGRSVQLALCREADRPATSDLLHALRAATLARVLRPAAEAPR
jgi:formylmethanofuran dehydrogenase subunit B